MAIKESAENWVRGAPGQALILVAAVGIVIGGVVGLGAGFKIEQNRTRTDVKHLRAQINSGGGSGGTVSTSTALGQRIGSVTKTTADTITLATKRQGDQVIHTTAATQFEHAVPGTTSDIVVGRRILVTVAGDAVIVLPPSSRIGRVVASVGSDSFVLGKASNAKGGSVQLNKVKTVDTISPATLADFKVGVPVLAGGRAAGKSAFNASEVILLQPGSSFAN